MRATLAGVLLVTALLTGGCGSEAIPADTAAVLVADSRAIEARLAAGDRCAADRRAQALLRKAEQAIAAKLVPLELAVELRRRTARLASTLTCPPPPPPAPPPVAVDEDVDEDRGEGNGRGQGAGQEERPRLKTRTHVGDFRLEELLGAGGMALVYRAVDERTGEEAALKLLADNLAADEAFRRRFLREARLAARLDHRNVVRVLDAGEHDGRPWIALEYVEGETLAEVLARRGRLPPAETVALGIQLCSGLQHAHDAGLVHRDVKPANIVVREDGSATIVDFGIARAHEGTELTEHGSVVGTASYLSPEQAAGGPVTGGS